MKLYDSLSNLKIDLFEPVTIYCCGPTVYNDIHIGNARPIITFDVLNRFLNHIGVQTKFVHNITDIDDKIINAAKAKNMNELDLSNHYYEEYLKILKHLNIQQMQMPKVSNHINDIISYIQKLINSKHAYVQGGDVYFDVKSIKEYGEVSHQNIDQLMSGVRKELSENKKSDIDFALWKQTNEGLNWDSPWSKGRPGWHTECAVFINQYFGDHVQIHGGGIDLKFPHHENENAQNRALYNRKLADIWMHVGHIQVNNEKMAKSKGNFILVKDLLKDYEPNLIRWFMYQTQYENPINFSISYMNQLKDEFAKLIRSINQTFIDMKLKNINFTDNKKIISQDFINSLNNDLNFPNAIKSIWSHSKNLRTFFSTKKYEELINELNSLINELSILGITYANPINDQSISLINEWKKAIEAKNYSRADEIRTTFKTKGII